MNSNGDPVGAGERPGVWAIIPEGTETPPIVTRPFTPEQEARVREIVRDELYLAVTSTSTAEEWAGRYEVSRADGDSKAVPHG
jgi:hypothetical protein